MKDIGMVPELYVKDFLKSVHFYLAVLGFSVLYAREESDFAYLKRGNAELMIEQVGSSRTWATAELSFPLGRGVNFRIETENVDELYANIKKNGIPIFLEMEEKWYQTNNGEVGNKQFLIQDPDGYLLRFYEDMGTRSK